jgi:uncharacterized protein
MNDITAQASSESSTSFFWTTAELRAGGQIRPLAPSERLPLVDVLRGVAILGVLVAYTFWNLGSPPPESWRPVERWLDVVTETLVDGKFITIFVFLFGAGTAQQWRRVEAHGGTSGALHLRRMLFLLSVGLLHAILLRNGDILAPYALLGIMLYGARRCSNRQLSAAVVVLAVLPDVIQAAAATLGWSFARRPGAAAAARGYIAENWTWVRYWYLTNPLLSWPRILALMLCGVLADRARLLARLAASARLARNILVLALSLAVAGNLALLLLPKHWSPGSATIVRRIVLSQLYYVAAWSLAAAYVAGLALVCQRAVWQERLSWLRAVGRMAFSNYLIQALILVPLCLVFELFDTVTPLRALALAILVTAIEVPFNVWWLRRHPYGPVEALWRRVTYGRREALPSAPGYS